ncbi:MAG: S41 family peptidase, partial [Planctomycetota bacterium]
FGLFAAKEVKDAVEDLERRGARALIVDLRNNTGGYLQQAKEVAELFLSKNKLIVFTKSRIEAEEKFISAGASFPDIPLVVLVNGNSASASEIVAGALQDHARAKIVGSQTYGKGSVQHLRPVPGRPEEPYVDENENRRKDEWEPYTDLNSNGKWDPGPRARITIAYYYLPSGRCLHKRVDMDGKVKDKNYGVLPDRKIDGRHLEVKELWKNAVINELWQQRVFHKYVDEHLAHNKARFIGLAEGDGGKTESYPGFEDFYKGLKTQLSRDDVRRWIRVVVREKVADYRGKAWPGGRLIGDYQEDRQLQGAIETALDMVGDKIVAFPEYKNILKLEKEKKDKPVKIGKK